MINIGHSICKDITSSWSVLNILLVKIQSLIVHVPLSKFLRNPSPVSAINSLDPWLPSGRQPPPPLTLLGSPRRPPSPASLSGLPSGRPEGSAQGSYPRAPLRCPSQSCLTGPPSGPPQGSLGDPLRAPPGRCWERNLRKWQIFAHFHYI